MNETYLLASILYGEAGVLGWPGMFAIGLCVMARKQSYTNPYHGFYGHSFVPSSQAYILARVFLSVSPNIWVGLFGSYPYCLSKQDRERLGFPPGDIVIGRKKYQINMYKRWPNKKGN